MNKISRANGLKIAAVLLWVIATLGIVFVGLPALFTGTPGAPRDPNDPFFVMFIIGFAIDSVTLVVAYGVWRAQRWGIILAIIISAFNALLNTGGIIGDPNPLIKLLAGLILLASICVIYLCLRQDSRQVVPSS